MFDVRQRSLARRDLRDILEFSVVRFGAEVAENYLAGFDSIFYRLGDNPFVGSLFEDISPAVRVITYRSHRVFYDIDGNTVWILRVLHHAMDVQSRLS